MSEQTSPLPLVPGFYPVRLVGQQSFAHMACLKQCRPAAPITAGMVYGLDNPAVGSSLSLVKVAEFGPRITA